MILISLAWYLLINVSWQYTMCSSPLVEWGQKSHWVSLDRFVQSIERFSLQREWEGAHCTHLFVGWLDGLLADSSSLLLSVLNPSSRVFIVSCSTVNISKWKIWHPISPIVFTFNYIPIYYYFSKFILPHFLLVFLGQ